MTGLVVVVTGFAVVVTGLVVVVCGFVVVVCGFVVVVCGFVVVVCGFVVVVCGFVAVVTVGVDGSGSDVVGVFISPVVGDVIGASCSVEIIVSGILPSVTLPLS